MKIFESQFMGYPEKTSLKMAFIGRGISARNKYSASEKSSPIGKMKRINNVILALLLLSTVSGPLIRSARADTWYEDGLFSGGGTATAELGTWDVAISQWNVSVTLIDYDSISSEFVSPSSGLTSIAYGATDLTMFGYPVACGYGLTLTYGVTVGPGTVSDGEFSVGGSPFLPETFTAPPAPPVPTGYVYSDQDRIGLNGGGDPVQLATGSETRHRTLFRFKGARDWDFVLRYNSLLSQTQNAFIPMALGYSHNFQASVVTVGSNLIVNWDQGSQNLFTPTSGNPNLYTSTGDGARYDMIATQTGGGWLLTRRDQSTLLFNSSGQLTVDTDPHGRILNLIYTSGQLTSIADPVSSTNLSLAYNSNGLLQTLTDGTGAAVTLSYTLANGLWLLNEITDQNGHNWTYAYDSGSQLTTMADNVGAQILSNTNTGAQVVSQADGQSHTTTFAYTTVSGVNTSTSLTDRNGNSEVDTFDSSFNELTHTDALGKETTYTYDSSNRVLSITDPLSRITSYTYDSEGNVLTVTDPASKVTTNTYDSLNNLLTVADPLGHVTTRTYDSNSNLLTYEDALSNTTTWTYNSNSQPITKTLPRGGAFAYAYTAGELTQVTDPNSIVTTFSYDGDGRLLTSTDALGKVTTCTYDAAGNRLTAMNPLSQTFTYAYDYRNRMTSVTDPTTALTAYTYDNNSNLLTTTDALSNLTTYAYTPEDQLHTVTDALSRVTTLAYDIVGQLLSVTDPAGNATAGAYDSGGQLTSTTDALGKSTTFAYELRGLLSGVTDPLSRSTTYTYDDQGRRITSLDPLSRQTNLAYSATNQLTQLTDPGSLVTAQAYDYDGSPSLLTSPASNATTFTHDSGDRLAASTTPAGRATTYSYDARGLPLTVTLPSTHATSFAYDNAERMSSFTDPVATVSVTRDADGRVLTVSESGATLTRVYDALGRLTSYTDGAGNVIGYQYDSLGRLTQLTYPGGKEVNYAYDTAGRLSTVTDWASRVSTYSYDSDGRMTQLLRPNGTKQVRTYDYAGQLTQVTDYAPDGTTVIYSAGYGYDLAGQLTSANLSPATSGVTPNVVQTVDQDDRLLTQNGSTATLDADGNLLSVASGVTPAAYTYDARNRLTSAGGLTYGYNSENRRVSLTDSTGTTQFAVNPNAVLDQVLVKTSPSGAQTFYVYGLGLLHEDTAGVGLFYHFDQRGDTVALSNSAGSVTATIAYGAYGEILNQTGTASTPFLFNGLWGVQTDSNGLNFNRARFYHPALRRWLNRDPLGLAGGLNLYGYVGNDPINGIDPFGLSTIRITTTNGVQTLVDATPPEVRQAIAALQDGSITALEIVGHGNQNFASMGKGATDQGITDIYPGKVVYTDTLMNGPDFAQQILSKLAPKAPVTLTACHTARGKDNIARSLSIELPDHPVSGLTGFGLSNELGNPFNRDEYIRLGSENHGFGITQTYLNGK